MITNRQSSITIDYQRKLIFLYEDIKLQDMLEFIKDVYDLRDFTIIPKKQSLSYENDFKFVTLTTDRYFPNVITPEPPH